MISVIIPVLDEEKRIAELLAVLKANRSGYVKEFIVVDAGSRDETVRIAEEAGCVVLRVRKKGRALQMNRGARHASGKILYFLHADTLPPPAFDRLIAERFRRGFGAGCFRLKFDSNHPALQFYGWCTRFKTTLIRFGDQSLFVERSRFDAVGGYDESLVLMEDQKMVRELKKAGNFCLMKESVITSSRKYETNGYIRLQILFTVIWTLYYAGAGQKFLHKFYRKWIRR